MQHLHKASRALGGMGGGGNGSDLPNAANNYVAFNKQ
jgi:hypothetical protein